MQLSIFNMFKTDRYFNVFTTKMVLRMCDFLRRLAGKAFHQMKLKRLTDYQIIQVPVYYPESNYLHLYASPFTIGSG